MNILCGALLFWGFVIVMAAVTKIDRFETQPIIGLGTFLMLVGCFGLLWGVTA
jgi:hypothetical protein